MMKNIFKDEVVLSHSQYNGYDYSRNFSSVVPDMTSGERIKGKVDRLTKFASFSQFLTDDLNLTSFFVIDNYGIFMRAIKAQDNRQFCEVRLRIAPFSENEEPIEFELTDIMGSYPKYDITSIVKDKKLIKHYQKCLLKVALSEQYRIVIFLKRPNRGLDDKIVNYTFTSAIPSTLVKNFTYSGVIKDLPSDKYKLAICYCSSDYDQAFFMKDVLTTKTFIFDFTSEYPTYKAHIERQPYSHRVINFLCEQADKQIECSTIKEEIEGIMRGNKQFCKDMNSEKYYNKLAFTLMNNHYKPYLYRVALSNEEYNQII